MRDDCARSFQGMENQTKMSAEAEGKEMRRNDQLKTSNETETKALNNSQPNVR